MKYADKLRILGAMMDRCNGHGATTECIDCPLGEDIAIMQNVDSDLMATVRVELSPCLMLREIMERVS